MLSKSTFAEMTWACCCMTDNRSTLPTSNGVLFGVSEAPPGYTEVRYCERIQSGASEEDIFKVLDAGDKHGPYLDIFTRAVPCKRQVEILPRPNLRTDKI